MKKRGAVYKKGSGTPSPYNIVAYCFTAVLL